MNILNSSVCLFPFVCVLFAFSINTTAIAQQKASDALSTENKLNDSVFLSMEKRWELTPSTHREAFVPRVYKPIYLLPITYTNHVNRTPSSPAADHSLANSLDLKSVELQFQLSFKLKLWPNLFGNGTLWGGYTQSSRLQSYNGQASRPFRETNYEPELMLVFATPYDFLGWKGRMTNISLNHQSNGQTLPLSRSWNRLILDFGLTKESWELNLRPWWRIPEKSADDDNPDISDYMGRGEILLSKYMQRHIFTLKASHTLKTGSNSRGSTQLSWSYPISRVLFGYLFIFNGYGENLIDYNISQNKIGLGISITGWR